MKVKKEIKYPAKIKVLRIKDNTSWWSPMHKQGKYYSSFIEEKQSILSFFDETSSEKFKDFIDHYKAINNKYPCLSNVNESNVITDNYQIYIEDEILELMKERCLLNGVSLVGIMDFDYTFIKNPNKETNLNVFDLKISMIDLLKYEEIAYDRQIDNLNYLLDF